MKHVCYKWDNADVKWANANWKWSECYFPIICYKWGNADVLWKDADWWWSMCENTPIPPIPPIPPVVPVIVMSQPLGVDATTLMQPWLIEPWNPYRAGEIKKKKVIELTFRMMGKEYSEKKETGDYKVGIEDVNIRVNPTNIDLTLKE
jgi:hypothetical protein